MARIVLGVIGNGRKDLLAQTVAAAEDFLEYDFADKIMINDAPSLEYNQYLTDTYGDRFRVVNHEKNLGLSGSVQSLWMLSQMIGADYVFHLEEDFIINQPINVDHMRYILDEQPFLAQIALKRQPCNGEEAEVGGFMEQNPSSYTGCYGAYARGVGVQWVIHRNFFTLNPSLYPISTTRIGWEDGWGEKEFSERLFADELTNCAYLGRITDPPLVTHIGTYRGDNWFV